MTTKTCPHCKNLLEELFETVPGHPVTLVSTDLWRCFQCLYPDNRFNKKGEPCQPLPS